MVEAIYYDRWAQHAIKMKLGIHILFNEHSTIVAVNIVVNNVVLVKHNKQPQAIF